MGYGHFTLGHLKQHLLNTISAWISAIFLMFDPRMRRNLRRSATQISFERPIGSRGRRRTRLS